MADDGSITPLEEFVLLAVLHLEGQGYGVTIREHIEERTGSPASITSIYAALERMEDRGFVAHSLSEPTPERGGRARKHFELLPAGAGALAQVAETRERMWAGVDLQPRET